MISVPALKVLFELLNRVKSNGSPPDIVYNPSSEPLKSLSGSMKVTPGLSEVSSNATLIFYRKFSLALMTVLYFKYHFF